jgi:RHS repeat-associated protein
MLFHPFSKRKARVARGVLVESGEVGRLRSDDMNLVVDGWTNRVAGQGYDAAGNMTHAPGSPSQTLGWDAESRMTVAWGVGGIWNYTYGAGNERVEALGPADGSRRVYFYDVTGELLGEYSVLVDGQGKLYPKQEKLRVWFAGRPLEWEDRLGSKVVGPIDQQTGQATRYRYYPYGQNIGTNVGWDDVQFATYRRDGATGLDYARNRYYTRTWGRFLSPDPYVPSGGPADPGSWNRYAYVQGDPVNFNDPSGLHTAHGSHGYNFDLPRLRFHKLARALPEFWPDGQLVGGPPWVVDVGSPSEALGEPATTNFDFSNPSSSSSSAQSDQAVPDPDCVTRVTNEVRSAVNTWARQQSERVFGAMRIGAIQGFIAGATVGLGPELPTGFVGGIAGGVVVATVFGVTQILIIDPEDYMFRRFWTKEFNAAARIDRECRMGRTQRP